MQAALQGDWHTTDNGEFETVLAPEPASRMLLEPREALKFGGRRATSDLRMGPVRVRIGRKATIHNLRSLYKRRGRGLPEEFDIFWSHEVWLLNHTVGLLRDEDSVEAHSLQYELVLDERAIIQGVLPDAGLMLELPNGPYCRADVLLNGRVVPEFPEPAGEEMENLAGGAFQSSERDAVVGRVLLPALTSQVHGMGPGCNIASWVFKKSQGSLEGYQPMATTLLLDKHAQSLACRVQVRLQGVGRNDVVVPLAKSTWTSFAVDLQR
jgi:hypothetical protein